MNIVKKTKVVVSNYSLALTIVGVTFIVVMIAAKIIFKNTNLFDIFIGCCLLYVSTLATKEAFDLVRIKQ